MNWPPGSPGVGTPIAPLISVTGRLIHRGANRSLAPFEDGSMAKSLKDKVEDTGHKMAEAATKAKNKVAEKVEEMADTVKEKAHQAGHRISEAAEKVEHRVGTPGAASAGAAGSTGAIKEHMEVYASCGMKVGRVDHVEGGEIKLTKSDSLDGHHHLIPLSWVAKVDDHVHLNRDHFQVQNHWETV